MFEHNGTMKLIRQIFISFLLAYSINLVLIFYAIHKKDSLFKGYSNQADQVACLLLEFENAHNDLFATVENVCRSIPNVIVYSETFIYPPINFSLITNCRIKVVELDKSIHDSYESKELLVALEKTSHLLILPDSVRINRDQVPDHANELLAQKNSLKADALVIPIPNLDSKDEELVCQYRFLFDVKRWTLRYAQNRFEDCFYENDYGFAVFLQRETLLKLSFPLLRPFLRSFIIQSQVFKIKVLQSNLKFLERQSLLFQDGSSKIKHEYLQESRLRLMYSKLGIKKIIHSNDSIEWHGCDRNQSRCFGSIVDNTPDYLVKDRWLPPCCRNNLEIVGRYVLDLLERSRIRYWLEGGSLLGAARNGQIIDWDYDIDIGIYQDDMDKLPILKTLFIKQSGYRIQDGQGFIWEKALEGSFLKVHYSLTNRIHVDIFPFVSINGIMTKDTWFDDHPQDMPFPEHFLQPLEKIPFIGLNVSVPNNIRAFLEMKFGKGSIEQPKFPSNKSVVDDSNIGMFNVIF